MGIVDCNYLSDGNPKPINVGSTTLTKIEEKTPKDMFQLLKKMYELQFEAALHAHPSN
ncbi:MAG TPA: hypothetical protein VHO47_03420 [Candidatus Babeliales bacterium]|nr:hypothetical protein [Candidatus Babeliales bacterium]